MSMHKTHIQRPRGTYLLLSTGLLALVLPASVHAQMGFPRRGGGFPPPRMNVQRPAFSFASPSRPQGGMFGGGGAFPGIQASPRQNFGMLRPNPIGNAPVRSGPAFNPWQAARPVAQRPAPVIARPQARPTFTQWAGPPKQTIARPQARPTFTQWAGPPKGIVGPPTTVPLHRPITPLVSRPTDWRRPAGVPAPVGGVGQGMHALSPKHTFVARPGAGAAMNVGRTKPVIAGTPGLRPSRPGPIRPGRVSAFPTIDQQLAKAHRVGPPGERIKMTSVSPANRPRPGGGLAGIQRPGVIKPVGPHTGAGMHATLAGGRPAPVFPGKTTAAGGNRVKLVNAPTRPGPGRVSQSTDRRNEAAILRKKYPPVASQSIDQHLKAVREQSGIPGRVRPGPAAGRPSPIVTAGAKTKFPKRPVAQGTLTKLSVRPKPTPLTSQLSVRPKPTPLTSQTSLPTTTARPKPFTAQVTGMKASVRPQSTVAKIPTGTVTTPPKKLALVRPGFGPFGKSMGGVVRDYSGGIDLGGAAQSAVGDLGGSLQQAGSDLQGTLKTGTEAVKQGLGQAAQTGKDVLTGAGDVMTSGGKIVGSTLPPPEKISVNPPSTLPPPEKISVPDPSTVAGNAGTTIGGAGGTIGQAGGQMPSMTAGMSGAASVLSDLGILIGEIGQGFANAQLQSGVGTESEVPADEGGAAGTMDDDYDDYEEAPEANQPAMVSQSDQQSTSPPEYEVIEDPSGGDPATQPAETSGAYLTSGPVTTGGTRLPPTTLPGANAYGAGHGRPAYVPPTPGPSAYRLRTSRAGFNPSAYRRPARFVLPNPSSYHGTVIGDGGGISLVQKGAGAPAVDRWRAGATVRGNTVARGTAIATFDRYGAYLGTSSGGHATIYDSQDAHGLWVWDQGGGQPLHRRYLPFKNGAGRPAADGDAYSVIGW